MKTLWNHVSALPRRWFLLPLLAALLTPGLLLAQADEEEEEEEEASEANAAAATVDWHEERAAIEKEISDKVERLVSEKVTPETTIISIKYGINKELVMPVLGDFKRLKGTKWELDKNKKIAGKTRDIQNIQKEVEEESRQKAARKFPESARKKIDRDAEEIYRMYSKGDKITITLRGGFGAHAMVEGYFRNLDSERIQINNRYVARMDLDELTEARFYPDVNERQKAEYIRKENEKYDARIADYFDECNRQEMPRRFLEANYVPDLEKDGASIRTAKTDYWIEKRQLFDRIYSTFRRMAIEKLTPGITEQTFTSHNYVRALNEADVEEWMPQGEAERIKQLKANAQQNIPNGMMPPPNMP